MIARLEVIAPNVACGRRPPASGRVTQLNAIADRSRVDPKMDRQSVDRVGRGGGWRSPLSVFPMRIRRLPGPPASIGHLQRDIETAGDGDLDANSRLWIAGESGMLDCQRARNGGEGRRHSDVGAGGEGTRSI